jgi:hypothetical protein
MTAVKLETTSNTENIWHLKERIFLEANKSLWLWKQAVGTVLM